MFTCWCHTPRPSVNKRFLAHPIAKTLSFISAKLPLDVQTMPGAQKTAVLPGGRVPVAMPLYENYIIQHRKAAREVNAKHAHAPRPKALNVRKNWRQSKVSWLSKVNNYPDRVWGRRVKDWKKWSFVQSCRENVNSRTRLWKHERGRTQTTSHQYFRHFENAINAMIICEKLSGTGGLTVTETSKMRHQYCLFSAAETKTEHWLLV